MLLCKPCKLNGVIDGIFKCWIWLEVCIVEFEDICKKVLLLIVESLNQRVVHSTVYSIKMDTLLTVSIDLKWCSFNSFFCHFDIQKQANWSNFNSKSIDWKTGLLIFQALQQRRIDFLFFGFISQWLVTAWKNIAA